MKFKELYDDVINLTNEFNNEKGLVTCEFSLHKSKLMTFKSIANLTKSKYGIWIAYKCKHCVEYHGNGYIHCELITFKYLKEFLTYYKKSDILFKQKYEN